MRKILLLSSVAMIALSSCNKSEKIQYPEAPMDQSVTDTYFGIEVADPYRPLENDTAAATLKWVEQENAVTNNYLSKIPFRQNVRARLEKLNNYSKYSRPYKDNDGMYYYSENDGLQNQSVIYRSKELGGEGEVFIDPNKLSDDGTVALTGIFQSPSGKYTAYTISRSGSDWTEIYVMDTQTKELLDDHIEWAKFTGAAWEGDEGFHYSAYPRPEEGKEFSNANEGHNVYFHKIGTKQDQDKLTYEDKANPLYFHGYDITENQKAAVLTASGQGVGNSLKVKDITKPNSQWITLSDNQDYVYNVVDLIDGTLYVYTNDGAPKGKILAIPMATAANKKTWKTLVAEKDNVLSGVSFTPNRMLLTYDKDAANHVYVYDMNGNELSEVALPGFGSVGITSSPKNDDILYTFVSYTTPAAIYQYDINTGESKLFKQSQIEGFNPDDYVTEQVFYTSKDGTKVPMFITHKKGIELNGKNPTYIHGYGGFNISLNPSFSANRLVWLENGGIFAEANLRGGSEYGEEWHQQGTKLNKLNVFNDFIAAAEYLIQEGYTSPEYLAIEGGSNGGLLIGAVVNMRPDLYKVAIPRVGVMDMMRYHKFTIGWNWASDYGTSDDSEEMAQYLLDYSPIQNIRNDGTPYPAILITTADHDDRVVPAHSFKYAATLQAADTGDAPKLIRIDSKAGHGAGKPISKVLDEYADLYSFIFYNMGLTPDTNK